VWGWGWLRSGTRVLTIGSVHLDTIALSSPPASSDDVIHIGNITHSVGGSAYNVAANLASHHGRRKAVRDVGIYSILPQHSVLTEIIKYKIDAAGIDSRFVRLYRDFNNRRVRGGGYVGILDDQRLVRQAVVDAAMHDANIFQVRSEGDYLESAFAWADALALDADLAVSIVNHVGEHALDHGKPLQVPPNVGQPAGKRCLYWIHTHTPDGIIHIESPAMRTFTLGDFFTMWGKPLSRTQAASMKSGKGAPLKFWVNGKPYTGDPRKIQLTAHADIVIQAGPPYPKPPAFTNWGTL